LFRKPPTNLDEQFPANLRALAHAGRAADQVFPVAIKYGARGNIESDAVSDAFGILCFTRPAAVIADS
jgi:hypothetical protein